MAADTAGVWHQQRIALCRHAVECGRLEDGLQGQQDNRQLECAVVGVGDAQRGHRAIDILEQHRNDTNTSIIWPFQSFS